MYYWREPSKIKFRGACHAVELAYVFGNCDETIYTGEPADKELSDRVMSIWADFARTGNPSTDDLEWTPFDVSKRSTMTLQRQPEQKYDIKREQRTLLSPLLKYMINGSYTELDINVPSVYKAAVQSLIVAAGTAAAACGIYQIIKRIKKRKN